jgi:hypothetical protein
LVTVILRVMFLERCALIRAPSLVFGSNAIAQKSLPIDEVVYLRRLRAA